VVWEAVGSSDFVSPLTPRVDAIASAESIAFRARTRDTREQADISRERARIRLLIGDEVLRPSPGSRLARVRRAPVAELREVTDWHGAAAAHAGTGAPTTAAARASSVGVG